MFVAVARATFARRGFTLIELLVVVAIIALLLSILLPSLERARAQARQVLCLTNLRSQGQAAFQYAEDNDGYIGRGIQRRGSNETAVYPTTVLKYLGFPRDTHNLWDNSNQGPLRNALRRYGENLQCPDFPEDKSNDRGRIPHQLLDYVASAMPIPYTERMIAADVAGGGKPGDEFQGETAPDYVRFAKLDDIAHVTNPARKIYVTEAHVSLPWSNMRFHTFFLTSMLPFGQYPRIASDQRHPGGITAMFFDSHAQVLSLKKVDPGWPNSLGVRLGLLSTVPEGYE